MVNIAIHLELKFNSIQIQLKRKLWMQIGGEGFENLFVNMMLKNKLKKDPNSRKHLSMPLYLGMASDNYNLWNMKLSYLNQLWLISGIFTYLLFFGEISLYIPTLYNKFPHFLSSHPLFIKNWISYKMKAW